MNSKRLSYWTGFYPCTIKNIDERRSTVIDKILFGMYGLIVLAGVAWLYCWSIISNDYDSANIFFFEELKSWFHWYLFLLCFTILLLTYALTVFASGLTRLLLNQYLHLHVFHIIMIFIVLVVVIAALVLIEMFWSYEWGLIQVSFQITGPFLQLSALFVWVAFSWYIAVVLKHVQKNAVKLTIITFYSFVLVFICVIPLWFYSPCIGSNVSMHPKPLLFAHRGVAPLRPENTLLAFEKAAEYNVTGFESDVHLSLDGIPFLMHDPSLLRTTDVRDVFPDRMNDHPSSFSWSELQSLNAGKWFLKNNPFLNNHHLTETERQIIKQQKIPSLSQFAELARKYNTNIIFDLFLPPSGHPFRESTINITVKTLLNTSINQDQVFWFYSENQEVVNKLAPNFNVVYRQAFPNASRYGIDYFNLLSSDVHQETLSYGTRIIAYTVNGAWAFSRAWCQGVWAVTTDYSHVYSNTHKTLWHMTKAQFLGIWITMNIIGIFVTIVIFLYHYSKNDNTVILNGSSNMLESFRTGNYNDDFESTVIMEDIR